MVPCEIYPVVWQARSVFGVSLREAKDWNNKQRRYVVDVLFCFQHILATQWVSDFCVCGNVETLVHLPSAVTENKYSFYFESDKVFYCFHGF